MRTRLQAQTILGAPKEGSAGSSHVSDAETTHFLVALALLLLRLCPRSPRSFLPKQSQSHLLVHLSVRASRQWGDHCALNSVLLKRPRLVALDNVSPPPILCSVRCQLLLLKSHF